MNEVIKPELEKLQEELTEVSSVALSIKKRQERIIKTANELNGNLKEIIQNNINEAQTLKNSEEKIQNLQTRIENSKTLIQSIKDKLALIKETQC